MNICENIVMCYNGGTCHDTLESFYCQCSAGYFGAYCEEGENYISGSLQVDSNPNIFINLK